MPRFRNITLSLQSQYDILTIPEYAPPTLLPPANVPSPAIGVALSKGLPPIPSNLPEDPFTIDAGSSNQPVYSLLRSDSNISLLNTETSTISVFVPNYPRSQFWPAYSIEGPHPPGLLYYFKLFLHGRHIVSWGCGEEDGYEGKAMFGIFRHQSGKRAESWAFCFGPDDRDVTPVRRGGLREQLDHSRDAMEIRVYRSRGRTRVPTELKTFDGPRQVKLPKGHPRNVQGSRYDTPWSHELHRLLTVVGS